MLRVTQQASAKAAKRYYATADYYGEGQEIVGHWGGLVAERLGLSGVVDQLSFDRLCDNLHPVTGQQLTARTRADRTVGYDFTFSVPKSVSLLYALTGDREILDAFRESVGETMRDIEGEMKARVRKGGRDDERPTGNMVWAEFVHTTSRPVDGTPDPQLHAHCFAFNATRDGAEECWKAGQFRDLKASAPYFQAAFRVRLANRLQELGFGVERKRDDFEVTGIPASAVRRFSRRTAEIEKVAAERGITDPDQKAELGALTRENKGSPLGWNELRTAWHRRMTPDERSAVADVHRRERTTVRPESGERVAVDFAIGHCFARKPVVTERDLLTEAMKRGVGAVTVEGIRQEFDRRPLIRVERDGRSLVTTDAVLAEERHVVAFGRSGRGRFRPLGDPNRAAGRVWLNAGQRAAVRHILGSRDRVTLLRGAAGTGKTSLMQEAVEGIEAAGRRVVVLAPSATASFDVLRAEGFPQADTAARFLRDQQMQERARGGVIWLDEAGLLGTADMAKLFDVAKAIDARVILSGDRLQHRAVARGEPLRLLEAEAGLPVAELTEIMRQQGDYRKAAAALASGDIDGGFAELDRLGWIKEVPGGERDQQLAEAYLDAVHERKRGGFKTALVVSPTHAEGGRITSIIRAALRSQGRLGEEHALPVWVPAGLTDAQKADAVQYEAGDMLQFHQNAPGRKKGSRLVVDASSPLPLAHAGRFELYRPAVVSFAVGDRLRVTVNGKTKDGRHRLNNGSLFTVTGFTRQGDIVVDRGWVIARDFGHVAQGYVVTSHASQGKTVDKVFIGESASSFGAANRRQFYVSASRGREQVVVFTDDKAGLLKAVQRPDEPLAATELVRTARRRAPLRDRLNKHLAFARRLATFNQLHHTARDTRQGTREQEIGHVL